MSDIPTGPMSHNDPIRDILTDLIEALWEVPHGETVAFYCDCGWSWPCYVFDATTSAEAKLRGIDHRAEREVTGDE